MRHVLGLKESSRLARILLMLLLISNVILVIFRIIEVISREVIFLVGLADILMGSLIAYDWLGEKPDYSQTSYVSKDKVTGLIFPYAEPKKKPKDARTVKEVKSRVDLMGLAIFLNGFLLIAISAIL
ncbi:MAG: hypothetical protein ACE5I5_20180 [Candidatus Heimdallarchaeota archaeon]